MKNLKRLFKEKEKVSTRNNKLRRYTIELDEFEEEFILFKKIYKDDNEDEEILFEKV